MVGKLGKMFKVDFVSLFKGYISDFVWGVTPSVLLRQGGESNLEFVGMLIIQLERLVQSTNAKLFFFLFW
jgi:hypothetical protein